MPLPLARPFVFSLSCGVGLLACPISSLAVTVSIHPSKDNTLFSENNNSNGLGGLFIGTTPLATTRRALLEFDIIGSGIPAGATINSVTLTLFQNKIGPAVTATFELRPLQKSWGEGTSSGVGTGNTPTTGDATWNYRFYSSSFWTTAGGDFGAVSGTTVIGTALGNYTFSSQAGMVANVQAWLNNPATNFGWIVKAANEVPTNAREVGSREAPLAQQPTLTIDYTAVPEPTSLTLLGLLSLAGLCRSRQRAASC